MVKGIAEREIATLQKQAGTDFKALVTDTAISTALANAAADENADLILIGRGHSQKVLGRFRTHAFELLSQATCPVFSYCEEHATDVMAAAAASAIATLQLV